MKTNTKSRSDNDDDDREEEDDDEMTIEQREEQFINDIGMIRGPRDLEEARELLIETNWRMTKTLSPEVSNKSGDGTEAGECVEDVYIISMQEEIHELHHERAKLWKRTKGGSNIDDRESEKDSESDSDCYSSSSGSSYRDGSGEYRWAAEYLMTTAAMYPDHNRRPSLSDVSSARMRWGTVHEPVAILAAMNYFESVGDDVVVLEVSPDFILNLN